MGRYGFGQGVHPDRRSGGEGSRDRDSLCGRYDGSKPTHPERRAHAAHGGHGEHGARESGGDSSGSGEQPASGSGERSAPGAAAGGRQGYPRSDERIEEELRERLGSRSDLDLSNVTVEAADASVTLRGAVPEHWMRQAIEDITDHCLGVQDIDNGIRIEPRG